MFEEIFLNEMKRSKLPEPKCKKEAMKFVKQMKKNPSDYYYQLVHLTEWGFWQDAGGQAMVSIDDKTAKKIIRELEKFLKYAPEHFILELNDMFGFCDE
jgi:hypothetical protein